MKLVGITQRVVVDPRHGERRDALDQRWWPLLHESGICAVPIPNHPASAADFADTAGLSGIIFSGGNDLAYYGGDAPERDATEANLLHWARDGKMPVLGICRGMQVILHSFGVPLHRAAGHVTPTHSITVDNKKRSVNSYHGFVARDLSPGLEAVAWASDGTIEAVRHHGERIAGIMWHPERNAPLDPQDVLFIGDFFGDG